jgi:hypothetical protein
MCQIPGQRRIRFRLNRNCFNLNTARLAAGISV